MKEGTPVQVGTETFVGKNVTITVSKEEWKPELDPESTEGHEALHAAIGDVPVWVSARPGRIGGMHYRGITMFARPPGAMERLAPAVMGGHGTSFDERNGHDGETKHTVAGAVYSTVEQKKGEIYEVQEALKEGPLTSGGVIAAKERGRMKMRFGVEAKVKATTEDGDTITITTKVNGDSAAIPKEIINFSKKKEAEDEAKNRKKPNDTTFTKGTIVEDIDLAYQQLIEAEKLKAIREELKEFELVS